MKKSITLLLVSLMLMLVFLPTTTQAVEEGWVPKASLLKLKDRVNLVAVNGKIYAIGGMSGNSNLNTVDEYDVATDKWVAKTVIPNSVKSSASSVVINGKIYITGGIRGFEALSNTLDIYDPVLDVWTKGANLPITVAGHSTQVVNGKIILMGGFTSFNNAVATTYEYDPATNLWSAKANMLQSRRYISSALVDGKIYVTGGFDDSKGILSSVEEYNPATNVWTKKTDMPKGRIVPASIGFNGLVYVIGGATATASVSGPATGDVDIYNPKTDSWTKGPALNVPKQSMAVTELNGKIYVAGGSNNSTYYNTFEMLDLTSTLPPVEVPTTPPSTGEPTTPPNTGEPTQPSNPGQQPGNYAILVVTMINGLEKEYDLPMSEIEAFTSWYDAKDAGKGPARFVIDKHSNNKGPFSKRTDSVIFNNILTFEVSEYTLK